jgi:glycerophosphoryl diester phosphodiesterase
MMLDPRFLTHPIAHRALHDKTAGRPENSRAAVLAAVAAGYAIEIDVLPSADGVPMVFHDYHLGRLTGLSGTLGSKTAAELGAIPLLRGTEGIPTLAEILTIVAGQVPLLIEVKDTDIPVGPRVGALEQAVAACLAGYNGPVAVMSFNPYSVASLARFAPDVPRGLTVGGPADSTYTGLPAARVMALADMDDFDAVGACFISYDRELLDRPAVAALKSRGVPILCWTVRSPVEEAAARQIADNITFEGYPA